MRTLLSSFATLFLAIGITAAPSPALAAGCPNGTVQVSNALGSSNVTKVTSGGKTIYCLGNSTQNPIFVLLSTIITFIIGIIGLMLVFTIVLAGLQYIASDGSADGAKAAKERIRNAVAGFLLLVILLSLLRFILPGIQDILK